MPRNIVESRIGKQNSQNSDDFSRRLMRNVVRNVLHIVFSPFENLPLSRAVPCR